MATYCDPSEQDCDDRVETFSPFLKKYPGRDLKFGHRSSVDISTVKNRQEHSDASGIHGIWIEPARKCVTMEQDFIEWGQADYPDRRQNFQAGGDPQSMEAERTVCVLFW